MEQKISWIEVLHFYLTLSFKEKVIPLIVGVLIQSLRKALVLVKINSCNNPNTLLYYKRVLLMKELDLKHNETESLT